MNISFELFHFFSNKILNISSYLNTETVTVTDDKVHTLS